MAMDEFDEYIANLHDLKNQLPKTIIKVLLDCALEVLAETIQRTPVPTGLLKAAWKISGVERAGDNFIVTIINTANYASFVEYGHHQEVGRYVPAIGKKLVEPWVEGKHMITVPLERMQKKLDNILDKEIDDLLKQL